MQSRITKIFTTSLQDDKAALASHYGALTGLGELGPEVSPPFLFTFLTRSKLINLNFPLLPQVVKAFILPFIKPEGERLQYILEGTLINNADRISADHVKQTILVSTIKQHPLEATTLLTNVSCSAESGSSCAEVNTISSG